MRYVISAILLLSLCLSLIAACAQPKVNLPPTVPKPPVTKPSPTSDNQSTKQAETPNPEIAEESWFPVTTFSGQVDETTPSFHIYGTEWRLTWTIDTVSLEKAVFKLTIYPKDAPYAIWQTVSNAGKNTGTLNYFVSNVDKRDYFIRISSQYVQNWTIEIEDNGTAATSYPIEISSIHYRGTVFPPDPPNGFCYERVEPDEYVVIKNLSTCFQDLTGWQLKNISKPSPTFKFPPAYILPGGIIRIYTDEYHPEFGGLTFYYGFGDIWSNDHADIAVLYDALGNEVYRKSYRLPMKIGGGD